MAAAGAKVLGDADRGACTRALAGARASAGRLLRRRRAGELGHDVAGDLDGDSSRGRDGRDGAGAATTGAAVGEAVEPALIAEAAAKTTAAKTARIATLVRVVEPGGQQRFGGQGKFDFERRAGEMALRLIEGEEGGAGFGQSKAVFVDSTIYYQLPPGALAGGRRWIQLDLQNVADASGLDFGPLVQGSQADPTQYLLWLSALGPGITKIGEGRCAACPPRATGRPST